jgi:hypothetical protein
MRRAGVQRGLFGVTFGLLFCAAACGDRVEVIVRSSPDAAIVAPSGRAGGTGSGAADAVGAGTAGSGGEAGGAGAAAGDSGFAGGGGSAGGGAVVDAGNVADAPNAADAENVPDAAADVAACLMDRDCPRPPTPCAVARCSQGRCTAANAQAGTVIPDVPGDCHDVVCDGRGGVASRPLDENDVPVFENPCVAGTCNKAGVAGAEPLVTGALCHVGGGDKVCDGAGRCVQCLVQSDCGPGLYCQRDHSCGTTPCTDVACGGGCTPCDLGGRCQANGDCLSFACDTTALTCIADHCKDHHLDANETDVDCGGGNPCARCPLGATCNWAYDCDSLFCDGLTHKCVSAADGCMDHAIDGTETDIDCGGSVCPPCGSTRYCKVATDCQAGLHCSGSPQACY